MISDDPKPGPLLYLVGFIQTLHLISLLVDLKNMLQLGAPQILAPGPIGGWSNLQLNVLLSLGTVDAALIVGYGWYSWKAHNNRPGAGRLGLVVLSGFQITALIYAVVVLPSGAIAEHMIKYGIISLAFIPVVLHWLKLIKNSR